jgi:hypothetical protein
MPGRPPRALADEVLAVAGPALAEDATILVVDGYARHRAPVQCRGRRPGTGQSGHARVTGHVRVAGGDLSGQRERRRWSRRGGRQSCSAAGTAALRRVGDRDHGAGVTRRSALSSRALDSDPRRPPGSAVPAGARIVAAGPVVGATLAYDQAAPRRHGDFPDVEQGLPFPQQGLAGVQHGLPDVE